MIDRQRRERGDLRGERLNATVYPDSGGQYDTVRDDHIVADTVFCGKYANNADKAVKLAKQLKCGFQGLRWGKGTSGHLAWCLIVDETLAQSEADARASELQDCTCHWYADQTMVQIASNIANKCGFTGLRWLEDKQAYFDWCSKMNPEE